MSKSIEQLQYENAALRRALTLAFHEALDGMDYESYVEWLVEKYKKAGGMEGVDSSADAYYHETYYSQEFKSYDETMELDPDFNLD